MLSRTVFGSLMLLLLANVFLASCAIETGARPSLPLTPPPIAAIGPRAGETVTETQTLPISTSVTITAGIAGAAESSATVTPAALLTGTFPAANGGTITATDAGNALPTPTSASLLPTVTPVPVLLPSPTPAPPRLDTGVPPQTPPAGALVPFTPTLLPVLPEPQDVATPAATLTNNIPLPASYQAQGSFASQTIYDDGTVAQQQGSFTISQVAAANIYGANQQYTLRTQRAVGVMEEINVYQIDDYIAVNHTGGEWMLIRRDQGSNIVRAIQPITDLAILFPRILNQAEFIGQEEIGSVSSLRYRLDDPAGQGARLIQPLLALSGEIRALTLEVWIAVPGGYVVAYDFQVDLAGARVLDPQGDEVRADQIVTWTYGMAPQPAAEAIGWPENAPTPDAFPVPGFVAGTFPIPPQTELLALVGGVPDLISAQSVQAVDSFYRTELFALGWTVAGEGGLLRCSKGNASFQLLIAEEANNGGSRITVLPGE